MAAKQDMTPNIYFHFPVHVLYTFELSYLSRPFSMNSSHPLEHLPLEKSFEIGA
jgi:hypothetical protein